MVAAPVAHDVLALAQLGRQPVAAAEFARVSDSLRTEFGIEEPARKAG